jgi:hypothetical protein
VNLAKMKILFTNYNLHWTIETEKPSNCRATTMGEESARSREREEVSGKYPKFHSAQT